MTKSVSKSYPIVTSSAELWKKQEEEGGITGIFRMKDTHYHDSPGYSSSQLKNALVSLGHMQEAMENPIVQTPAMLVGSAVHTKVLEPHLFDSEYCVFTGKDRRTKAYRQFCEDNKDKQIITMDDESKVNGMACAVAGHGLASSMLTGGEAELSVFWVDNDTGLQLRARLDYVHPEYGCVDLKTTSERADKFYYSIKKYSYGFQAVMYTEAMRVMFPEYPRMFSWVIVEKSKPHGIIVDTPEIYGQACEDFTTLLKSVANATAMDEWTGYPETPVHTPIGELL